MRQIISQNHIKLPGKAHCEEWQNSRLLLSQSQGVKRRKRGSLKQMLFRHMEKTKKKILMKYLKTTTETKLSHLLKMPKGESIKIHQTITMVKTLLMTIRLTPLIKICSQKDKTDNIMMKRKTLKTKKMNIIIMFLDN